MGAGTCRRCGRPLRASTAFCVNCGEPIGGPPQAGAPGAAPYPPVQTLEPTSPVSAPPTDAAPRDDRRRLLLVGVTALVLTLLARVAFAAVTAEPSPEGEIVASLPVGSEGGSAAIEGGGSINVPEGALDRRETIVVRRTTVPDQIRAVTPSGGSIVVPAGAQVVYVFSPATIVFARPVTIVLPAPSPPDQGTVFITSGGQITFVQNATGTEAITIRVNSFDFDRGLSVVVT